MRFNIPNHRFADTAVVVFDETNAEGISYGFVSLFRDGVGVGYFSQTFLDLTEEDSEQKAREAVRRYLATL